MQKLLVFLALSLVAGGSDHAQKPSSSGGVIYSCTDARGRIFTDRPIPECVDGEQLELRTDGGVRRRVEVGKSAHELAEQEERESQAKLHAAQQSEQTRRDRALLVRYPDAAAHERERAEALANIDAVIVVANKRIGELMADRKKLNDELEFYRKDPSKAPATVRRRLEDNAQSIQAQERFIVDQEVAKSQINTRFDEERTRLGPLWAGAGASRAR